MDRWGIEKGMIGVGGRTARASGRSSAHPDRFIPSVNADPNQGMDGIRAIRRDSRASTASAAVGLFPAGTFPQVADQRPADVPDLRQVRASWASPSSAAPACPGRGCRWRPSGSS